MGKKVNAENLYDFNKMAYNNVQAIPSDKADEMFKEIRGWFAKSGYPEAYTKDFKYHMLLCRELADYTIFVQTNSNFYTTVHELQDLITSRGSLLDIVRNEDSNAYEFWIRAKQDGQVHMYMLFHCDDFVIVC